MQIRFSALDLPTSGTLVVFVAEDLKAGAETQALLSKLDGLERAAKVQEFTGAAEQTMTLLAPAGSALDKIIVVGLGGETLDVLGWMRLGGRLSALLGTKADASVFVDLPDGQEGDPAKDVAPMLAYGVSLRAYTYDRFKTTSKKDGEPATAAAGKGKGKKKPADPTLTLLCAEQAAAKKAFQRWQAVADGVNLARDLVNDPANVLGPEEFAARCSALSSLGVTVEVLGDRDMKKLGMGALLAVGQGSERESRLVVMRWKGTKKKTSKPVAFVGKGVVFDSGGISIKPSGGMEDMKGDMAGAACVTGLMHALAARKAKVDAIGIVGLVENMPDGRAQRPGDIVTSMSGQTIEIINTDAEGRLVLADALHYTITTYEPQTVINLATLTGAVIVALGHHYAGMFTNSDDLAEHLTAAGEASGDQVWRLPLGKPYDKLIESKFADMKNTGGRSAGSITAAQFLKRFVGETPWAHLDIAGTGMSAPKTDVNDSWGSGFGVRLLDRYVADVFEGK